MCIRDSHCPVEPPGCLGLRRRGTPVAAGTASGPVQVPLCGPQPACGPSLAGGGGAQALLGLAEAPRCPGEAPFGTGCRWTRDHGVRVPRAQCRTRQLDRLPGDRLSRLVAEPVDSPVRQRGTHARAEDPADRRVAQESEPQLRRTSMAAVARVPPRRPRRTATISSRRPISTPAASIWVLALSTCWVASPWISSSLPLRSSGVMRSVLTSPLLPR